MRVVVVGPRERRQRLLAQLAAAAFEVVAEYDTLPEARAAENGADAVLLVPGADRPRAGGGERVDSPAAPGPAGRVEALTRRELEVLELLAEGMPNKAIARRLSISDQTVKFHIASILGKLGASNRTDAVRRAVGRGLLVL